MPTPAGPAAPPPPPYTAEAGSALLRIGFEDLRLHRIQAEPAGRNTASAGVLERLGVRREGQLRENEFLDGEWSDEVIYAMPAREWRAQEAGREPGGEPGRSHPAR